jgi:hypothetical protein
VLSFVCFSWKILVLGLFCLLFLEDLVFGCNLSLRMSSGANPSDYALPNADAIFPFIIPDKQLLCLIKALSSVAI